MFLIADRFKDHASYRGMMGSDTILLDGPNNVEVKNFFGVSYFTKMSGPPSWSLGNWCACTCNHLVSLFLLKITKYYTLYCQDGIGCLFHHIHRQHLRSDSMMSPGAGSLPIEPLQRPRRPLSEEIKSTIPSVWVPSGDTAGEPWHLYFFLIPTLPSIDVLTF